MPDYDVGAVSLSVPPASAVIQPYRPAVLVRNYGVHDALAVGSIRIYDPAGLLIFTSELYSGVIAPGETGPAQAVTYWTPPALGKFMFIAYTSCINDQNSSNDNLPPVFVQIIPGPPEPPTPVMMHASQHEEGGGDEIIIDGLHGRAADPQDARAHKNSHQVAGADSLNVTGLPGILAERQPIAEHHEEHEDHGADELNVSGLMGVLSNLQKPQIHANEAHNPNYATSTELSTHLSDTHDVHPSADNLEQRNQKGNKNGYCPLDDQAMVPAANLGPVTPAAHAESHEFEGQDQIYVGGLYGLLADLQNASAHAILHEHEGSDEISIANLSGKAADPQDPVGHHTSHEPGGDDVIAGIGPTVHHTSHENGGADEISLAGLSGKAADAQDPTGHHVSHEPGGSDPITGIGSAPHKTSHENGGADEISIAGLSGKAADAQDPTSHTNSVHSTLSTEPPRNVCLDIGNPGDSSAVARANHRHTGPGSVKTAGGYSFCLWNEPRPMIEVQIGLDLYDRRGLTLSTLWRGVSTGYVVGHVNARDLEMRARLTTASVTHDLCTAIVTLPAAPGLSWYFMFDVIIHGHSAGVTAIGRLTASLEDGTQAQWAQSSNYGSPVPFITSNSAILDIAAKLNPFGVPDAGIDVSGIDLLYTPA